MTLVICLISIKKKITFRLGCFVQIIITNLYRQAYRQSIPKCKLQNKMKKKIL